MKISKVHLTRIIESGRFLNNMIGKLDKEALMKCSIPLAEDILP